MEEYGILCTRTVNIIVDALKPGILGILALHSRPSFHLVVLSPYQEGDVFYNQPIAGPVENYKRPYNEFAMKKATLSARTRQNTRDLLGRNPTMLLHGDIIYTGGLYYHGVPIGGSGAPAEVDHAICTMVGTNLVAYCRMRVEAMQKAAADGGPFVVTGQAC